MPKESVFMPDAVARDPVEVRETDWLRAAHRAARFVFRGDTRATVAAGTALGAPLATVTGRAVTRGSRAALALGPDEHLFIVAAQEATTFPAELGGTLAGLPHSLVDVSHRQVGLELRGAHAEWLLAAACPLPLDAEAFPVDACTRTVFAKAEVVLWRVGPQVFRVEVARSYCRYVVGLLDEVARELPSAEAGNASQGSHRV
jgi:sarcosine oxidase subunit gamma